MERVKMFLFARWIATCYADEHCDNKMISQHEPEFDGSEAMSVLNRESGFWWQDQLKHFENVVYPNLLKNGSVANAEDFLNQKSFEKCKHYDCCQGRNKCTNPKARKRKCSGICEDYEE